MRFRYASPLLALLGLLLFSGAAAPSPAPAGLTGKIAGRVVEAATGIPLPGVNVAIEGTTQGSVTDLDGYYTILKVKPGTYSVRASFIGFTPVVVQNVQVEVDKTTTVDFDLQDEVVVGEEIVVTAERPIVQVDRTTTSATIGGEQIDALPARSLADVINLQAGIVAEPDGTLHFRGGRGGEVAYLVNGVPINNAYSNNASFDVEQNMVESLEVISGVFNAEYGQALSGVVNIVTKDAPKEWSGSLLGYVGAVASGREVEFLRRTEPAGSGLGADAFETERVSYSEAAAFPNLADVQLSLGGPILRDRLGIRGSLRYFRDESHLIGRDLFSPTDSSFTLDGEERSLGIISPDDRDDWSITSTGDGDFYSLNNTERVSVNTSVTYLLARGIRIDYNAFVQDGWYRPYQHFRKYVPRGINRQEFFNQTHILGLRLSPDANSFVNVSYSYLRDRTDIALYDEPTDLRYAPAELNALTGTNAFSVAGNDLFTSEQLTQTHTIVADYTRQVTRVHMAKIGLLARLHSIDNRDFGIERSFRTGFVPQPSLDAFSNNRTTANPRELSAYIQDKMELRSLIVNMGLRFDLFDPDYNVPVEWTLVDSTNTVILADRPDPDNPGATISNRREADVEWQVSPRVGIAFPISSTGVMRFSAGLFFQIPSLSLLYTNPEYEINKLATTLVGNPDLDPERTLSFEVGLQQGLTDDLGMELTIFSKDVRNLTGQEIFRLTNGDFAVRWINRDYGTIRGLTAALFQRPVGPISWSVDYTLQFAEGTSSRPGEAFEREQAGLEPILSLVRLDWDRRHVLNNTITLAPSVGALRGLSITVTNRLQSGTPYTTVRDFVVSTVKNNGEKPLLYRTDLRMYYSPPFLTRDVQLFLQVDNLTDQEQVQNVYADTGEADESVTQELFRRSGARVGGLNGLDEWFYRQEFFGAPRRVSLGLNVRF